MSEEASTTRTIRLRLNGESVRAQMAGSVLQTYADQGQSVAAGTVLARIEAGGTDDSYLSARSAVTAAQNSYSIATRELERAHARSRGDGTPDLCRNYE